MVDDKLQLISRKRHYFYVLVFSIFAWLFVGMLVGIINPYYVKFRCQICDNIPHEMYSDMGFFVYGAGALLWGIIFSYFFHRIMLVANSSPKDKKVPLSRFARYGRSLIG